MRVDSEALNTFLTVYRSGGVSNGAKVLHRSQPAISRRLALLERELGVPLFERVAGRVQLSDAGRLMVPYAERAVAATLDAFNAVRSLTAQVSGPVSLVVVGTLAAVEYPDVSLTLRTATSAAVADLIRQGEATIGLRYSRANSPDLDCELLFTEPLQVVCAASHPLAGRFVARLAELHNERWIAFPEAPGRSEIAASHITALLLTRGLGDIAWTAVDSLTAQKRLVEAGFGIALLSESHVADELRSSVISTIRVGDISAKHDIVAVTRRGAFMSAASHRLLEIIRSDYKQTKSASRRKTIPKPGRRRIK
jgi:DNA-binding transcriptional LysR family regulator